MGFPVATRQTAAVIDGVHTEFIFSAYDSTLMVVATQLGKMGTLMQAKQMAALDGEPTYSVETLLGRRDEPLLHACARRIAQALGEGGNKRTLLLSLGLKSHEAATMKAIAEHVIANPL